MKRFLISSLSVLLAAGAISPAVEAKPHDSDTLGNTTFQQRRLAELDLRDKSVDSLTNTTLQQHRLDGLDARDKS